MHMQRKQKKYEHQIMRKVMIKQTSEN